MFFKFKQSILASCILYGFAVSASYAAGEKQLLITAVAGKEVCQSTTAILDGNSVKPELCVTQGSFSHDNYTLKIDGKTLLKGIDDETTMGITANFKNHKIILSCSPQNVFPKATPEETLAEVRRAMPNSTLEETMEIANLLGPGPMGMEIGRLCAVNNDDNQLMSVQILFK
jgi:hypothetical protein